MEKNKLIQLYELISEWLRDGSWNTSSEEWRNIVETRRQVEIDIKRIDPNWESE